MSTKPMTIAIAILFLSTAVNANSDVDAHLTNALNAVSERLFSSASDDVAWDAEAKYNEAKTDVEAKEKSLNEAKAEVNNKQAAVDNGYKCHKIWRCRSEKRALKDAKSVRHAAQYAFDEASDTFNEYKIDFETGPCTFGEFKTITTNNGQSTKTCHMCEAGTYQSAEEHSNAGCNSCGAGKFQSNLGAAACDNCPAGKYQDQSGAATCKECKYDRYQKYSGAPMCVPVCGGGSYYSSTSNMTPGKVDNDMKEEVCTECSAGKSAGIGESSCTKCEAGKYQNKQGQSTCKECTYGEYQGELGQTSCEKCYIKNNGVNYGGYYQPYKGKAACMKCVRAGGGAGASGCVTGWGTECDYRASANC